MRHFAVHIDELKATSFHSIPISATGATQFVSRSWHLPELTSAHLKELKSPKVDASEISMWNQETRQINASLLLEDVLRNVRTIIEEAERLIP